MAHSFTSLHLHMIFSTKNRDPIMDEYLEFLQRHEVEYDARFVFE